MSESPERSIQRTTWAKLRAHELGFDLVGIAPAQRSGHEDYLRRWIASGQMAQMSWLEKHLESLLDVRKLLPGARSIVSVAASYAHPLTQAMPTGSGRIARYALGDDYHEVFKDRLHILAEEMRALWPGAKTKCGVDITPILEREHASAAGIGWIGKNTCIIHPDLGSWLLLGQVITSEALVPDAPMPDRCGSCRRCLEACPTGALTAPYQLDARRCISYLNIEHRGGLTPEQQDQLGEWLVGCDICQEVCPHNRDVPEGSLQELHPRRADGRVDLDAIERWTEEDYRREFRNSAVRRVKLPVLQENARAVLRNQRKLGVASPSGG